MKKIYQVLKKIVKKDNNDILEKLSQLEYKIDIITNDLNYTRLLQLKTNTTTKKRILICGYYGVVNYGDDLMLRSLLENLNNENLEITVMICGSENSDFMMYPNANIIYMPQKIIDIKLMASYYDAMIWGGGTIDDINYNYNNYSLNLPTIFIHLTKEFNELGKKTIIYGISLANDLSNKVFIKELNNIVKQADLFAVRDEYSFEALKTLNINVNNVKLVHDLVFGYDELLQPTMKTPTEEKVLLIDMNLKDENEKFYIKLIIDTIEVLEKKHKNNYKIILQPYYSYMDYDKKRFNEIKTFINNPNIEVGNYLNTIGDFVKVVKNVDYCIATRYHTSLMLNSLGKPLLFVDYNTHRHYFYKNKNLNERYIFNKLIVKMTNEKDILQSIEKLINVKQGNNIDKKIITESKKEIANINKYL